MAVSLTPTLATPGIGSGLDINGLVSKLMAVEQQPLNQLSTKQTSFQSKLSTYGSLKGVLSSLQTAAKALETKSNLSITKATSADTTVLSASSSATAVAGSYNVVVTHLAQAQKLASGGYASTTAAVATGTLPADLTITYADPAKTPLNISIDSSHNTLAGIRDTINGANAGITASIINDGTTNGNRLVISANNTGALNGVSLSSTDPGLSALATGMTEKVVPQNAQFTVDGIAVTKSSNTVTDAIQGVTLNIAKLGTSQVTVAQDTDTITSNIQAFVTAYNNLNSFIKTNTAYDPVSQRGAALAGDSSTRSIQQALRNIFNTAVSGAPSGQSRLTDIGISFQKDGSLAVDSAKLKTALADPNVDIANVFAKTTSTTGYASQINTTITGMLATGGVVASRTEGINATLKSIENQKTALSDRLAKIQKTYLAQFNALDSTIASMNSTSSYLTQQLAAMTAANTQK